MCFAAGTILNCLVDHAGYTQSSEPGIIAVYSLSQIKCSDTVVDW